MTQQWENSRRVVERMIVAGQLVLTAPAHFGNGDTDSLTDIPLLRDPLDPTRPLLTGASIAGALRNYLREWELGYGRPEQKNGESLAEALFGHLRGEEATVESWLMVDDALGFLPENGAPVEIRDGVAIDPASRTAEEGKKYDIELLAAGTTFPLHFELWLPAGKPQLRDALLLALRGFEAQAPDDSGHIRLGMRKRRGFGRCRVTGWQVSTFEMDNPAKILEWLNYRYPDVDSRPGYTGTLPAVGPAFLAQHQDARRAFRLEATFRLTSSLLIRADSGRPDAVDMVHLRSWRAGAEQPVLSGTSLAGALRGRALRIAKTLINPEKTAAALVDDLFGRRIESAQDKPSGSRLLVTETVVEAGLTDRVQNRVKLNRFTGGAYPQALFSQQPLFAREQTPTVVKISLLLQDTGQSAFEAQVGLLLLLLKDLWTGDLPLGGESSVGRGVLAGQTATLTLDEQTWKITATENGTLAFAGAPVETLEDTYLAALTTLEEAQ